jgi:hypothetical protein
VLGFRGEMSPIATMSDEYMLDNIMRWRISPQLKLIPGVKEAVDDFLAKMAELMQGFPLEFPYRHQFTVSYVYRA